MPRAADAVYAFLSLVSYESETAVEAATEPTSMSVLSVGRGPRFLAVLSVVHEGTASMNAGIDNAWLFLGQKDVECVDHVLPHGLVSLRSYRAPDKETSNEDAAAIISFGRHALILAIADGVGGTPGGREASNLAVRTLRKTLARTEPPVELPTLLERFPKLLLCLTTLVVLWELARTLASARRCLPYGGGTLQILHSVQT